MRAAIATRLKQKTRDDWQALFENTDACVAPVLSLKEAPNHPHNRARKSHTTQGMLRASPAPRFSRTPGAACGPEKTNAAELLARFGITGAEAETLASAGIVGT